MPSTVCVIIAAYNYRRYVERALESVFGQSLPPDQIIVVDDHSTDGTYEFLKEHGPRITLTRKPEQFPKGPASSHNLALGMTDATFVACLDADDVWTHNYLRRQVTALQSHPEAAAVYCNGEAIDCDGKVLYSLLPDKHAGQFEPSDLLVNCFIRTPSSVLIRRSILDQVGLFNEQYRHSHDHDMWIRIREVSPIVYVPEKLMYYRRHSAQGSLRPELWRTGFRILTSAMARYPYSKLTFLKRYAVLRYHLGEGYWQQRRMLRAVANWCLAGLADPGRALKEIIRLAQNKFGRTTSRV